MPMAVMAIGTSRHVILITSRTTGISTGRRGTGTINRPGRIGPIGTLTTIPIIAGARTEPARYERRSEDPPSALRRGACAGQGRRSK